MRTTMDRMAKKRSADRHKDRHMMAVPGNLHDGLRLIAERNGRPISWELRLLLRKFLAENGIDPETGKPKEGAADE